MIKNNELLCYLLTVLPIIAIAEEELAIQSTNFEVGGRYENSKIFKSYFLNGIANIQINKLFGANIGAYFRDSDGRRYGNTYGIGTDSSTLATTIFVRDPSIGRAALLYALGHSKSDNKASSDRTVDSDSYSLFGEYYLKRFTIFASRIYSSSDRGYDQYSTSIAGAWYILDNMNIVLNRYRANGEYSDYATINFQPSFLNNSAGVSVAYASSRYGSKLDSITVSLNYYFDTRVSLIDRDRRYR